MPTIFPYAPARTVPRHRPPAFHGFGRAVALFDRNRRPESSPPCLVSARKEKPPHLLSSRASPIHPRRRGGCVQQQRGRVRTPPENLRCRSRKVTRTKDRDNTLSN